MVGVWGAVQKWGGGILLKMKGRVSLLEAGGTLGGVLKPALYTGADLQ